MRQSLARLSAGNFFGRLFTTDRKMMRMQAVRSIAKSTKAAITAALIMTEPLQSALANENVIDTSRPFVVAQSSFGGPEQLPPSLAPTPVPPAPTNPAAPSSPRMDYIPPSLGPRPAPSSPRTDYIPPSLEPRPAPGEPNNSSGIYWGAIAFTADGSYSSVWKVPSQPEAEASALKQCARFGRGGCEVVSFSGQECVALATFIGNYRRRRWNLSFTAGGTTYPDAQKAAINRCNSDERSQGQCQPRTAACADGR
jgi:hypothetical protein